ncbi:MAG: heme exporter protein CcmB [Candidatus Hydrogenedentota bacterium]
MNTPAVFRAFLAKDVLRELRTKETFISVAAFGFLVILVLAFALPVTPGEGEIRAAGAFWVAVLFASQVGIARAVDVERASGRMETILSTPADASAIFLAKSASLSLFVSLSALILSFPLTVFYQLDPASFIATLPGTILGIIGICLAGTLLSLLASGTRMREVLAPILFLTIFVPLLLASVAAMREALLDQPYGLAVQVLAGFDLIIGGASILLAPYLIEEG